MNLDDLQHPMTANRVAHLLKKHFDITVPVKKLNEHKTKKLLKKIQNVLNEYRNGRKFYQSLNDKHYTALMLTEQFLKTKVVQLNEESDKPSFYQKAKAAVSPYAKTINSAVSSSANKVGQQLPRKYYGSHGTKLSTVRDYFSSTSEKDNNKTNIDNISTFSDFGEIPTHIVLNTYKNARVNPDKINPQDAKILFKVVDKLIKNKKIQFNESKRLLESAMSDAEVVLAAKDIADRFQDMVESLGKMVNEELPALTETIRDTMGAEQAEAFNSSASQTINSALENIRSSKEELDSAARTLAGEEQPLQQPMSPEGDLEAPGSEELDQIPASASGEEEEPLGRGKR